MFIFFPARAALWHVERVGWYCIWSLFGLDVHVFRQDIAVQSLDIEFSSVDLGHPDDIAPKPPSLERRQHVEARKIEGSNAITQSSRKKMISPFSPMPGNAQCWRATQLGVRNPSTITYPPLCPVSAVWRLDPLPPLIFSATPTEQFPNRRLLCVFDRLCCCPGIYPAVESDLRRARHSVHDDTSTADPYPPPVPDSWST